MIPKLKTFNIKSCEKNMTGRDKRRSASVALAVALFLSIAVYFRLWMVDYSVSSHDTELLRRQFDLANREAMDESAEWRLRFDEATDKASKCYKELGKIKESIVKKEDSISFNNELEVLRKENAALLEQVETVKGELEDVKRRCRRSQRRKR